jgi:hypothetical protein
MKDNYSNDVVNNNGFSIHTVIKELVVTHYLHIIPMMWWCGFFNVEHNVVKELDDGWPESEKRIFQAALSMVVVKNSRWMVGEVYMSYGGIGCEK